VEGNQGGKEEHCSGKTTGGEIMGRYRKILVAVDGSPTSLHALEESFKLAQNEGSWITVVSVIPPYTGDLDLVAVGGVMAAMRRPCEEALRKAQELAEKQRALIKTVCEEGEPHERIIDLAQAENCDLIVIGRRGLRRLERVLVGSVTARVIGYSPIDVLVVTRDTNVGFKKVLIATDGSRYSELAKKRAIDFAGSYGGELVAVSAVDMPSELFAEEGEFRTAREVIIDDLRLKGIDYEERLNLIKERCRSHGVEFAGISSSKEDPVSAIKSLVKDNSSIDMVLLSPSITHDGHISARDLQRLVKSLSRPIVTMAKSIKAKTA
jgi:nucleotide-binding universal stress UspA family protein